MEDSAPPAIPPAKAGKELTALIARLEAATSRLEDMASFVEPPATNGSSSETPANVDAVVPVPAHAAQQEEPLPDSITAFDEFLSTTVKKYVELSDEIGGIVAEQVVTLYWLNMWY